jgi:acyl carrier protein
MAQIRKFRDLPGWQEIRKALKEAGMDPNLIAEIGGMEGDSLDLVEMTMAFEEALAAKSKRKPKS